MKTVLDIDNFGIRVHLTNKGTYQLEVDDICAPVSFIEGEYDNIYQVVEEVASRILNPNNVYAMEDQPEEIQTAYQIAGIWDETDNNKETTRVTRTFLELVIEGVIRANA